MKKVTERLPSGALPVPPPPHGEDEYAARIMYRTAYWVLRQRGDREKAEALITPGVVTLWWQWEAAGPDVDEPGGRFHLFVKDARIHAKPEISYLTSVPRLSLARNFGRPPPTRPIAPRTGSTGNHISEWEDEASGSTATLLAGPKSCGRGQ